MRAWLFAMLAAATLVAAPSFADPLNGKGSWMGDLFGTGGNAEPAKVETADPNKKPDKKPSTTIVVPKDGKDGKDGVDGKNGTDGKNGKDGKDGKSGATRTILRTGKPGRSGRDSKLADYPGTAKKLWDYVRGLTKPQPMQWECIREAKRRDACETRMRQEADKNVRREAREGDERVRNEMITSGFLICLLVSAAFFCGARRFGR